MKRTVTLLAALLFSLTALAQSGGADTVYVGEKPVLTFRRGEDIRAKVDSLLCAVGRRDQAVRADWAKIVNGNVTQEEAIEYALKMEETDSTNLVVVSHILDSYGWLDGLSKEADKAISLVIDHSDLETMNKYQSLFHEAAEKGHISVNDLVTMEDRMLMNAGKPQIYGTQAYALERQGESIIYIWPVEEPEKLNERRAEVGLSPIEVYLEAVKQQGVTIYFDPNLKVEDFNIQ